MVETEEGKRLELPAGTIYDLLRVMLAAGKELAV
jgi:hypothetical protein